MKDIYRNLIMLVQNCYTTIENSHRWTLLHLSTMVGLPCVNDNHIMALCKCVLHFSLGIRLVLFFFLIRYPCHKTISLLLQCGANIDAIDSERETPLHLIAQRKNDIDNVLFIINLLCDTGKAHPDCVNARGQTPLESASNVYVKEHLRGKIGVSRLKCICARLIRQRKLPFQNKQFSSLLVNFIEKH